MLLPQCPICLTNENMVVDSFTVDTTTTPVSREELKKSLIKFHCSQDGYHGVFQPFAKVDVAEKII